MENKLKKLRLKEIKSFYNGIIHLQRYRNGDKMQDNVGNFIMLNNKLLSSSEAAAFFKGNTFVSVYEVIRVIDKKPLFLDDHYQRLLNSLKLSNITTFSFLEDLKGSISSLLEANGQTFCNVRIVVSKGTSSNYTLLYIAKSSYPTLNTYKNGVSVGLFECERQNPNVKLINVDYKTAVTEKIDSTGVYEVLLVNHEGFITEGSRSNVFFIKETTVFTAPAKYVLEGITRKYVIQACKNAGLTVVERLVSLTELLDMDGMFLSGTSIKALPISQVDELAINSPNLDVMQQIMSSYENILSQE